VCPTITLYHTALECSHAGDGVGELVEQLNNGGDLKTFCKQLRHHFKQSLAS